ncbi:MAG: hypothetical protein Phog2KO_13520 [Phototrophicaceae bacterium]
MSLAQEKPSTYDMWSASARNAYDQMERRALKAEQKLVEVEQSFIKEVNYLTPVDDTLSWNVVMMRTLNDILSEATSTLDPSKIFDKVTQTIGLFLNASRVQICAWDSSHKTVTTLADYINHPNIQKNPESDADIVYHLDADFEQLLLTCDGYWLSYFDSNLSQAEQIEYERYGVKTFFYAPMYTDGELFGFIKAWDVNEKRDYSDNQKDFVITVANHISSSVRMAQLHHSLAESEQRYRQLMDTMQGGVARVDTQGTIQYVNQHFARVLGYSVEELISQNLGDVWDKHAIETDKKDEYRIDHDDGTILYVQQVHAPIMTKTMQIIGEVFVYTDVSKRKEAEKMAVELTLEQEHKQLLGKFIQDTSHEFYTPLSIINMKTHLLKNQHSDERTISAIKSIQKQTGFISELVKALVLITYLDSVQSLELAPYNLRQILKQVVEKYADDVVVNKQELIFEPNNNKVLVSCDTEYFVLALNHIIKNALRYTPENGTIKIYTEETPDAINIIIEDSGIGMTAEQQTKIFNHFYRVDTARSTHGFGLGLSLVKRIIKLHHGEISVDSALGQGTKITINLPQIPSD